MWFPKLINKYSNAKIMEMIYQGTHFIYPIKISYKMVTCVYTLICNIIMNKMD